MTFPWLSLLYVALGGAIGSGARFILFTLIGQNAVLISNITGCFLIGAVLSFFEIRELMPTHLLMFLTIGLLGGFTTFSAFSAETFALIDNDQTIQAILYILLSVIGGLVAFLIGRLVVRRYL